MLDHFSSTFRAVGSGFADQFADFGFGFVFAAFWRQASFVFAVGWIASSVGSAPLVTAVAFGTFVIGVWRAAVFKLGWLMSDGLRSGTLVNEITAPASVRSLYFGRLVAVVSAQALATFASLLMVLLIGGWALSVPYPLYLGISVMVAIIAVSALCYFVLPLNFLAGGLEGFFNALIPFVSLVGGFIYPMAALPKGLQPVAALLPTSWAMEAVRLAINGDITARFINFMGLSLVMSVVYIAFGGALISLAEYRVRRHSDV